VIRPAEIPADLQVFLDSGFAGTVAANLAYRELYVEEQVLGEATSRFVKEGGVRFCGVKSYVITADNLEPMAVQQRGLSMVQLELLKFWFMIDPLPPSRNYISVSVRIALQPPSPAFLLEPKMETTHTDLEKTSSAEFAAEVAHLLQVHLVGVQGRTVRRTEELPLVTAINHGAEGFGWTFQAQEDAPLFPREVVTIALVELPRGTRELSGLFDTEALISRRVLAKLIERPTAPINAATPFTVDLDEPPLI
jgi:hypothetical protein